MKQICVKCFTETLCPECNPDLFNKEVSITITTCKNCHVELFRSMTYETKEHHVSFCITCFSIIEAGYTLYEAHRNKNK
jgi:hypothetical protein